MNVRTLQLSREIWIFLAVTGVMSAFYLYQYTGPTAYERAPMRQFVPPDTKVGQTLPDVGITLITADALRLACASDQVVNGQHCAFKASGEPWGSESNPENVMMPYMTVDNVLFLVPGLWEQPVLKKRLQDEPPSKYSIAELEERRFTARCALDIVGEMKDFKVRWDNPPRGQWGPRDHAMIGKVKNCKITGG